MAFNLVFYPLTIVVCVLLTILHEAAHAWVGTHVLKLKPAFIAVGLPVSRMIGGKVRSTIFYTWERPGKIPVKFSWMLVGGAVAYEDGAYYKQGDYWKKVLMILAGPFSNIISSLVLCLLILGPSVGSVVGWSYLTSTFAMIWATITLTSVGNAVAGSTLISSSLLIANAIGAFWPLLSLWLLWNFVIALVNLLPLPGLDGGQVITQAIVEIFGNKVAKPIMIIDQVFLWIWIILCIWGVVALFI